MATTERPLQPEPTPAPVPPVQPNAAQPNTARSNTVRWVLSTAAGVGLLAIGLLGGILIGQHTGPGNANDRGEFAMIQHEINGQGERIPEQVKEWLKNHHIKGEPGNLDPSPSQTPEDQSPQNQGDSEQGLLPPGQEPGILPPGSDG